MKAEVPGVSEAPATLAAAVHRVGTVNRLVTVRAGALAEGPATGLAQEGRPSRGGRLRGGPVRGPRGRRGWACPSAGKGRPVVRQPPSPLLKCLLPAACGGDGGTGRPVRTQHQLPFSPQPPHALTRGPHRLQADGPLGFQMRRESTFEAESFSQSGGQNSSLDPHSRNPFPLVFSISRSHDTRSDLRGGANGDTKVKCGTVHHPARMGSSHQGPWSARPGTSPSRPTSGTGLHLGSAQAHTPSSPVPLEGT